MGGEQHWQQASPEQQIMALERALTHPTVLGLEITQLTRPKSEQLQSVGYKGKQEVWLLRTGSGTAGLAGVALAETTSGAVRSHGAAAIGAWNRFEAHGERGRHEPQNNIGVVRRLGSA